MKKKLCLDCGKQRENCRPLLTWLSTPSYIGWVCRQCWRDFKYTEHLF